MNAKWLTLVVVIIASAVLLSAAVQQNAAQLYQSGVYAEEIEGNLQKAIGIYEQVLKQFPNDQNAAANAQLHIGLCYERMGLERAREAYEKVIKNYPGQSAAVAVAREKLDAILRATSLGKNKTGGATLRQIATPRGTAAMGRVSPDGKYLADWGGGDDCDVWISEVLTGKQRFLTTEGKGCSQGGAYGPHWSPDSTKLAFTWRPSGGGSGLRVVALDGSPPWVLAAKGDWGFVEVLDWTPDGRHILTAAFYPDRQELRLVSVADGSTRPLKTLAAGSVFDGRFSSDGLYIAYSRPTGAVHERRDIFLLSADGSRETPLIQHQADDALVEWLPGGRGILFASDRAGTYDLWSIQIEKGQPQGVPTLVRRSIGPITPLGLTKDGALYYRTPASFMDVYSVSLDPKTGNVVGPPKKEPLPWEGSNRWPDWSPDGKRLAYVSVRPTVVGPFQPGRAREWIVCVYSADTGKVREYPHQVVFGLPRWTSDGRHLYLRAAGPWGRGFHWMDVENGEVTPLLGTGEGESVGALRVSADQKWIVYAAGSKGVSRILRRDASTGEEKELDRTSFGFRSLALSRDGSHLAWLLGVDKETKVLKVMPFPDGTPKEILRSTQPSAPTEIAWSRDNRFIFFSFYSDRAPSGGNNWHLWRVPAEGGTAQDLGMGIPNFEHPSIHPDGSRLTFSADTIDPERSQVWVLENFLPAGATRK